MATDLELVRQGGIRIPLPADIAVPLGRNAGHLQADKSVSRLHAVVKTVSVTNEYFNSHIRDDDLGMHLKQKNCTSIVHLKVRGSNPICVVRGDKCVETGGTNSPMSARKDYIKGVKFSDSTSSKCGIQFVGNGEETWLGVGDQFSLSLLEPVFFTVKANKSEKYQQVVSGGGETNAAYEEGSTYHGKPESKVQHSGNLKSVALGRQEEDGEDILAIWHNRQKAKHRNFRETAGREGTAVLRKDEPSSGVSRRVLEKSFSEGEGRGEGKGELPLVLREGDRDVISAVDTADLGSDKDKPDAGASGERKADVAKVDMDDEEAGIAEAIARRMRIKEERKRQNERESGGLGLEAALGEGNKIDNVKKGRADDGFKKTQNDDFTKRQNLDEKSRTGGRTGDQDQTAYLDEYQQWRREGFDPVQEFGLVVKGKEFETFDQNRARDYSRWSWQIRTKKKGDGREEDEDEDGTEEENDKIEGKGGRVGGNDKTLTDCRTGRKDRIEAGGSRIVAKDEMESGEGRSGGIVKTLTGGRSGGKNEIEPSWKSQGHVGGLGGKEKGNSKGLGGVDKGKRKRRSGGRVEEEEEDETDEYEEEEDESSGEEEEDEECEEDLAGFIVDEDEETDEEEGKGGDDESDEDRSKRRKETKNLSGEEKPMCKFGAKCYRKNPQHLKEFRHPTP